MTNQTRTEPLDRLAELEQAATFAPWEAVEANLYLGVTGHYSLEQGDDTLWPNSAGRIYDEGGHTSSDAAFIAAFRNAAPSLIAEAREAARLRSAAEAVVALLLTSGEEPPPLNDYGLMSTLAYYAGPNARTAVDGRKAARVTALGAAARDLRAALVRP